MIRTQPLSNDPSFDDWATRLVTEAVNHRHAVWTIGDLMMEGLNRFDEPRVWTAAEGTGMTPETLTNYKSLAKSFPRGKRRLNLGVSIHEVVRTLDDASRDAALDLVERHELTREALRERVKAYKGGDLAALNSDWKPPHKVIEVEDSHAGVSEEDKPVFDSGAFGEAIEAERGERERADFTANDANQDVLAACRAVERIDIRMVDPARLSRDAIKAAIAKLGELEDLRARHDARHIMNIHSAPDAVSAEARARTGDGAALLPASSPTISTGALTAAGSEGEGDGLPGPRTPEPLDDLDIPAFLDRRQQNGV